MGTPAEDHTREKAFLLAGAEGRALGWLAPRLPARVLPDHLTALGLLAALAAGVAYGFSGEHPVLLLVAGVLLAVNWFGDSLDGTLARTRRIERPSYGYYLDHLVDGLATAAIGVGLGLSPYLSLEAGLAVVVAYLLLSINTYLETQAFGVFSLGYGRVGPTEARLALATLNVALFAGVVPDRTLEAGALAIAGGMVVALLVRAAKNLRVLAAREPSAKVRPA